MKLGKRLNRRRQGNSKLSVGDAYEILERRNLLATYTVDFSQLAPSDYSSNEILVRFHDDVSVDDLKKINHVELMNHNAILSASLGEGFRADGQLFEIPVIAGQSIPDLIDYYNSLDTVEFAEPNYLMESTAVPNDQYYGYQWGPPNINAESAWDTRTDSSSIIVGVIDSGVQYDHPDLQPNIWTNSGEIAGNGIDDDNNGYVDDFYGYDFDNDDSDPMDDNGHGTHVAGTIGAQGNNSFGVAGVGWDASLMSLKVIGGGSNADVARAIDYATDNGAKITNNSYGYAGTNVGGSSVMSAAIGRAKDAGVLYVVAAGNRLDGLAGFQPLLATGQTPQFSLESSGPMSKNNNSFVIAHRVNSQPLDQFWGDASSDDLLNLNDKSNTEPSVDLDDQTDFTDMFKSVDDAFAANLK